MPLTYIDAFFEEKCNDFLKFFLKFTNYLHFFYKKSKTRRGTPLFWCPLRDKFSCFGLPAGCPFFHSIIDISTCQQKKRSHASLFLHFYSSSCLPRKPAAVEIRRVSTSDERLFLPYPSRLFKDTTIPIISPLLTIGIAQLT